jgi:hypothetical protein
MEQLCISGAEFHLTHQQRGNIAGISDDHTPHSSVTSRDSRLDSPGDY